MIRTVLVASITIVALLTTPVGAEQPTKPVESFSKAKRLARDQVYHDKKITLYCACSFRPTGRSGGQIGTAECGYRPRKNETRGRRLEWEHIVPASTFGSIRECWKEGHRQCVNSKGKPFRGRKCCAKVDEEFERMEADLHNLVPSVGELNGDRSNHPHGLVATERRLYGKCDFEIDGTPKEAQPKADSRGDIARVWRYMAEAYDFSIPASLEPLLDDWNKADLVDDWEKKRDARIKQIQGNSNRFLTGN